MLINVVYWSVRLVQEPNVDRGMIVPVAVGLVVLTLLSRTQALRAQDRLIRLEERLGLQSVLSPELAARAMTLAPGQLVALRFASDGELSDLVERTLNGEFAKPKDIKLGIKDWRADHFRV
jgi:hypothetical protein